jgi:hypothetical protein
MRLHGQRWVFQIGNSTVKIDNAFTWSWSMWGQERMIVNDELLHTASGTAFSRTFIEPWLTPDGDGTLEVHIYGGLMSLICEAKLDGRRLEPEACHSATWSGDHNHWPAEEVWEERPARHKVSFLHRQGRKARPKG